MARDQFIEHYRTSLAMHGLPLGDPDALEGTPTTGVPVSLQAWYEVAGNSRLNSAHNRILGPGLLRYADDKVIFAVENQEAVVWGFDAATTADDPEIWQGQTAEADDRFEWYSEEALLSRFLMTMLDRTISHERPIA
ncbi:MAG: hypothetical protein ABI239_11810 [Aquihabitans sp.]